jgi:hypothetical protein
MSVIIPRLYWAITISVLIIIGILYIMNRITEGFCSNADIQVYDLLSFSYKCTPSKKITTSIPKCRSNQILMVANPSDSLHCGTIQGNTRFTGQCKVNTQDSSDYKLICPETAPEKPAIQIITPMTSSIPLSSSSSSSSSGPAGSPSITDLSTYSTVSDPTTFGLGIPNRPTFGARYQTIVSNLIIQSKPSPCSTSSGNSKDTPSNINYDKPKPSDGSSSSSSISKSIVTPQPTPVTSSPGSAVADMSPTIYKTSEPVNSTKSDGSTSSSPWSQILNAMFSPMNNQSPSSYSEKVSSSISGSNVSSTPLSGIGETTAYGSNVKSNTYQNIPFPYMPSFNV